MFGTVIFELPTFEQVPKRRNHVEKIIFIGIKKNKRTAKASTTAAQSVKNAHLQHEVNLEAEIEPNTFGGLSIQHPGSTGTSATQLNWLIV